MNKQQIISDILGWAPGNADRQILESMAEQTLRQVHQEAWEVYKREQHEELLQLRAQLAAANATAELAKRELIELRRPQFEAKQKQQLELDRTTFAAAAKQLGFSRCDANWNMIVQVCGSGFTIQNIQDQALHLGVGFELVPATQQELNEWASEDIKARNSYLTNVDPQTLRNEAKQEASINKETAMLSAFERDLLAGLQRDLVVKGLPRLPDTWNGKRLDKTFRLCTRICRDPHFRLLSEER